MFKEMIKRRNQKGFTLVELIVVIAILGILAAIAVPRLIGFKDEASKAADEATAATIAKAAELHSMTKDLDDAQRASLNVGNLVDEGLIDDTKPQYKDGGDFKLKHDGNIFEVVYTNSPEVPLYPKK